MSHSDIEGGKNDSTKWRDMVRCPDYDKANMRQKFYKYLIEQKAPVIKQISSFTKDLKLFSNNDDNSKKMDAVTRRFIR